MTQEHEAAGISAAMPSATGAPVASPEALRSRLLLEQSELFGEVARDLLTELPSERVLRRITDAARRVFEANVGISFVEDGDVIVERVISGVLPPARMALGEGITGVCATRRSGVIVNDYLTWPSARAEYLALDLRRGMAQPLLVGDELLGVITLGRTGPSAAPFSEEELALLGRFADQAALVLRSASLFETAARRRLEAEALTRVARQLTDARDAATVGRRIVDSVLTLFRHCVGTGVAMPKGTGPLLLLATGGPLGRLYPPGHELASDGFVDRVWREQRPISIADLLAERENGDPTYRAATERLFQQGVRAFVALPLRVRDGAVGVLAITFDEPRAFGPDELTLARAFADQAALALDNARVYEEADRGRREAEVLAEIARTINASHDVDAILQRVTAGARALAQSDIARIALRDPASDALVFRYWVNTRYVGYEAARLVAGTGSLGGLAMMNDRPVRTDDWMADPRFTKETGFVVEAEGIVAQMAVPIRIGDVVEGLIYVDNRAPRPFTDADEAALVRLAEHAAIAIRNAQLFAERRRAEAALRESEQLYRLLAENAADVICVFDLDRRLTFVSPSVMRLRGYTPDEAMRQKMDEQLTPASRVLLLRALAEDTAMEESGAADPGRSATLELEVLCRGGSTVWTETTFTSLRDDAGRRVGFLAVSRDITERRRAETALRDREAQFRQAQKMEAVGRLAGGVAHDFNNLLTVIRGRSQLGLQSDPNPVTRRALEVIDQAAVRAATLTHQLLAFSRKQVLQPTVLDLDAIVLAIERMLRSLIGEGIELVLELGGRGLRRVLADEGSIEQVIMNLAVNARDAMPKGGRLTVRTGNVELDDGFVAAHLGAKPGPHVLLEVEDTGTGMDIETQTRLFEPFFTTKGPRGTGLGRATVYGIVNQHGGYIRVDSQPGAGSTFGVYLPPVQHAGAVRAERAAASPDLPAGTETILLVEDEEAVRAFAVEALRLGGYTVLAAADGIEAAAIAGAHPGAIHLLVTDVVMPQLSGPDLAERLLPQARVTRVLYMSGYPDDALGQHGILRPGTAFLAKPFTLEGIAKKVREVLDAPVPG